MFVLLLKIVSDENVLFNTTSANTKSVSRISQQKSSTETQLLKKTHRNTQLTRYLKKCICMYLHTGVKRVCTKNVTLTHNYKEKAFSFSSITSIEKTMYRKKGRGDEIVHEKQTYSHTVWFK